MKSKVLCLQAFLIILFVGCKTTSFKSQEKRLELMGNPTTGYTWTYIISDESIIQVSEDIQYLGKGEVTGAPSLFLYRIESLKPGKTKLRFEYKRPWEKNKPDQVRFYEVTVRENGKINMNEKKWEVSVAQYKSVTMTEGLKLMEQDKGFILLDVRRPDEYAEGHIPGAIQLTNETFTEEAAAKVIKNKEQAVYVYCRSGRRSKEASQKLIDFGYENIIEIGGILDYSGKIEK